LNRNLDFYCTQWNLSKVREIKNTPTSSLYLVKQFDVELVLKLLSSEGREFESHGAEALKYFNELGAARVFKSDEWALLIEYIDGTSLKEFAENESDSLAVDVVCEVVKKIHSREDRRLPNFPSTNEYFKSLFARSEKINQDSIFKYGAQIARSLVQTSISSKVLHGDIHHENILSHSKRGWLAIDPQPLIGEPELELANSFFNPKGSSIVLRDVDRILRLSKKYSKYFGFSERRVLQYAIAYGCLKASWHLDDAQDPKEAIEIVGLMKSLLEKSSGTISMQSNSDLVTDEHYLNPKLARIYDFNSGWNHEREFYLKLAGDAPKKILDLGCGTGLICNALAANGHQVTGVDPAIAMLNVAREREFGDHVNWIQSRAQDLNLGENFDLIIMTGNAFQVFLTETDLNAICAAIQRHLSPEGLFVFESRNPNLDWSSRWNYENIVAKSGLSLDKIEGDWNHGSYLKESTQEMIFYVRYGSIRFAPVESEHISLLMSWYKKPHVSEFWQETDNEDELKKKFLVDSETRGVSPYIILIGDRPIGFIQCYEARKVGGGWWSKAKSGTFGIDQFIGEIDFMNKGWGAKIIRQFVKEQFENSDLTEIITDPVPTNTRAIRCYEKVGFHRLEEIVTPDGPAILMRIKKNEIV
jgi:streptomycin 6-kinase/ubiquinone/menaquinone biosynthesis C-methylase UbiE/RimJ/RimL family protein N-acetyltransferase